MTRENQIALEAARHTHLLLERNTFDVNYEEDNYDAGRLHTIEDECPNTFARGAEWRGRIHHSLADSRSIPRY